MANRDFLMQLQGYGLSTVEIHYYMPDHPRLLQQFVIQQYDVAPRFPVLRDYLERYRGCAPFGPRGASAPDRAK